MQAARGALALAGILTLTACGGGDPDLIRARSAGNGPDAFSVVPSKPLEMPDQLSQLPAPTPGGANRTDPNPTADAIVALGGNPNAVRGVPASDGAIVAAASRYGREDSRAALAAEDREYRRANPGRFLNRVFGNTTYYQAYEPQSLDQQAELERWRNAGRRTPAAPPPNE